MIRKISGKSSSLNVGHLNVGDDVVTSKPDIADALANTFAEKSSSSNYSAEISKQKRKTKLNFKSNITTLQSRFHYKRIEESIEEMS